ncbi:ABC transporter ATP-binding protein [Mumia zhuanghuii]|uniref:ABC transporter ATP-binding protein n=1 Tax=Mumia zhuanghuii TaxID=2585211 RepID=A0A5C4MNX4_9ACTN|nr:ABC transporter ATP-binding protein [Mumia zhuanghuii]TNC46111.1 ABC transporter ATP-binding protein [Mumia zhuanghuii]TNC48864.1 ABC transporter ATP-binding protein [Mumia zhuanghuii]
MTEPIISVQDVSVRFHRSRRHRSIRDLVFRGEGGVRAGEFWGLRHISFDVQPGEAIGVVGRNGQGKSTLLKTIAGVLIPDEGRAVVNGGVAPLIEITGGFVGDLTVRDNIFLAAGLHGMSKKQIKGSFEEIVEFAEIEDFVDTPYKHLSSGMKVRVAFSVVSRLDEPIMLVDEVLAVGDRAFREKCFERIDEMLSEGRTLFMVSHSEANLTRFCSRGLYLREGTLVHDGPISEVVEKYFSESGNEAALRRRHERRMRRMRERGLLGDSEDDEDDDGDEDDVRTAG